MRILNFHTYIYNNFELFIKCIDRLEEKRDRYIFFVESKLSITRIINRDFSLIIQTVFINFTCIFLTCCYSTTAHIPVVNKAVA